MPFLKYSGIRRVAPWVCLFCQALLGFSGGVTVITHGFNGNVTDWVIPMANKVTAHPSFPGTNASLYRVTLTRSAGEYSFPATALTNSVNPLVANSGEIIVAWDWSSFDGAFQSSTVEIAQQLANALLATNLIPELNGRPLAQFPLHLVGHSRGASLVAETARFLGARGVWVDHLTLHDPYPLGLNGDPSMKVYANVFYADNYWQNQHFPQGQSVPGAYNRYLSVLTGGYSDTDGSHSDVHLWYHGTVDLATPTGDVGNSILAAQRATWWTGLEAAGTNTGFRFSLIAGGDRFSALEPAGTGTGKVNDGLNRSWNLGAGIAANRAALPSNDGSWPNVIRLNLTTPEVPSGQAASISLYWQAGASTASPAPSLRFFLDRDLNALNGNEIALAETSLPASGTQQVLFTNLSVTVAGTGLVPGLYRLGAVIGMGANLRSFFAPEFLRVTSPPQPLVLSSPAWSGGTFHGTVSGTPGRTVLIEFTTNLTAWLPVQTNQLTAGTLEFTHSPGPVPAGYYRARSPL